MSLGQPKALFVLSRRQREQPEGMAVSGSLSAGRAVRVPSVFPNASEKHIRRIGRRTRFFEIDGSSPIDVSKLEVSVTRSIAT